jgi:hypothetical protein
MVENPQIEEATQSDLGIHIFSFVKNEDDFATVMNIELLVITFQGFSVVADLVC